MPQHSFAGGIAPLLALAIAAGFASASAADAPRPATAPRAVALCPGDLVDIRVYDNPDLATVVRVPAEGAIEFPLIGAVSPIAGRSVDDLAAELKNRLQDGYLRVANVTATVTAFAPRNAYVSGSVGHAAAVPLDPSVTTTALQAIAAAGGFAPEADRANLRVVRDDGRGGRIAAPFTEKDDAVLAPNDLVVVPRLDQAYVDGQVKRPGPVVIPGDGQLTLVKALAMAGGFDRFAKRGEVQLIRKGAGSRSIDVRDLLDGKRGEDPVLKPGDVVYVPESRF